MFSPDPRSVGGWQWLVTVEGSFVRVDFLCDNSQVQAEHVVPISATLGVMNLRGVGYVMDDFVVRELTGALASGESATVDARFAGVGGYLLTKCVSATTREKAKDFYDLAYVLLYNRIGGPDEAGKYILARPLAKHVSALRRTLLELRERFRDVDSIGARSFVDLHEIAAPGGDRARLAQDAVTAVDTFVSMLLASVNQA